MSLASAPSFAAPSSELLYRVTNVRGSIWRYDYTLVNTSTSSRPNGITLFETYFPTGSARNIGSSLIRTADGWRAVVAEPIAPSRTIGDPYPLGRDGAYQARAMRPGAALRGGGSLSGFSVEFEWLAPQPPIEQDYLAIHTFDTQGGDSFTGRRPLAREIVRSHHWGSGFAGLTPTVSYYEQGRTRLDPSVPEPGTLALVGSGLVGLAVLRLRRRTPEA